MKKSVWGVFFEGRVSSLKSDVKLGFQIVEVWLAKAPLLETCGSSLRQQGESAGQERTLLSRTVAFPALRDAQRCAAGSEGYPLCRDFSLA
ncbi:hypothetical protein [Deinococcus fonticola]|uniref:hypothetical protein n=1 Tax=Deinococcus fonticola TaxID=2528713 RepID=UPI0010753C86|nr:hypothetical protein [Deinococcus fonticola]